MTAEGGQIRIGTATANESGPRNTQAIVLNRIEDPQSGIGAVARYQNNLNACLLQARVEAQQLLHQRKSIPRCQHLVLMIDLVLAIGLDALALVDAMTFAQVEQRPRGNRQYQLVTQSLAHESPQFASRKRSACSNMRIFGSSHPAAAAAARGAS